MDGWLGGWVDDGWVAWRVGRLWMGGLEGGKVMDGWLGGWVGYGWVAWRVGRLWMGGLEGG